MEIGGLLGDSGAGVGDFQNVGDTSWIEKEGQLIVAAIDLS